MRFPFRVEFDGDSAGVEEVEAYPLTFLTMENISNFNLGVYLKKKYEMLPSTVTFHIWLEEFYGLL